MHWDCSLLEISEPLGPQHGDDEVEEEGDGDEAENDCFHGRRWRRVRLAHLVAEVGEGHGHGEEAHRDEEEGGVAHEGTPCVAAAGAIRRSSRGERCEFMGPILAPKR